MVTGTDFFLGAAFFGKGGSGTGLGTENGMLLVSEIGCSMPEWAPMKVLGSPITPEYPAPKPLSGPSGLVISGRPESNRHPPEPQAGVQTTYTTPYKKMEPEAGYPYKPPSFATHSGPLLSSGSIERVRFELTPPCFQGRCSGH